MIVLIHIRLQLNELIVFAQRVKNINHIFIKKRNKKHCIRNYNNKKNNNDNYNITTSNNNNNNNNNDNVLSHSHPVAQDTN